MRVVAIAVAAIVVLLIAGFVLSSFYPGGGSVRTESGDIRGGDVTRTMGE